MNIMLEKEVAKEMERINKIMKNLKIVGGKSAIGTNY